MKYLENEKLTEWTAELSDASLGQTSHRIIDGRLEAYTMKRAGNDKKYAYQLGQRYVAEIEEMEQVLAETIERATGTSHSRSDVKSTEAKQQQHPRRKRSFSAVSAAEAGVSSSSLLPGHIHKRACSTGTSNKLNSNPSSIDYHKPKKNIRNNNIIGVNGRFRSQSFDATYLDSCTSSKTTLGDFSELATRRLMTDLILTLNASFPDYDFSTIKPNQFEKLQIHTVRDRIFERLSELASFKVGKADEWLVELWAAINDAIDFTDCDVYSFSEKDLEEDSLWSFHYFFVNKSLRRIVFFTCIEKIDTEERQQQFVDDGDLEEKEAYFNYAADSPVLVDDVDWDPSADVAGGIGIPISTV